MYVRSTSYILPTVLASAVVKLLHDIPCSCLVRDMFLWRQETAWAVWASYEIEIRSSDENANFFFRILYRKSKCDEFIIWKTIKSGWGTCLPLMLWKLFENTRKNDGNRRVFIFVYGTREHNVVSKIERVWEQVYIQHIYSSMRRRKIRIDTVGARSFCALIK